MTFLITFVILSIVNVVFSTIRSITTIKSGKTIASIISGGYYAFYNIMLIYTVADFPLWQKCVITFVCNVIGVFVVKLVEEKMQKEKLWKIEATITNETFNEYNDILENVRVPHNYIDLGSHYLINFYCATRKQSEATKIFLEDCNAKYFVSEAKNL